MDVLVIESAPGIAATLEHRLVRDGHQVVSCNDSHGGPCVGVEGVDDITVQREYQRIHVTLTVAREMSALTIRRLVDRVRQAVRAHDAHTSAIDISVVEADTPIG